MRRALRGTLAGVVVGVVAAVGIVPGTAGAHVTVSGDATQGGFSRVAFRVPNESDDTFTVKLEVFLPEATPIAFVSTMPVPGWTTALQRKKLDKPMPAGHGEVTEVVTSITWTAVAPANSIKAGEFMEFPVSLGPLPQADKLVFKALQTYSDNEIVRWIEEPGADGKEPEHPAPTLALKKAAAPAASSGVAGGSTVDVAGDGGAEGDSGAALWVAIVGLVAGIGGLVLGGLAFMRTRKA